MQLEVGKIYDGKVTGVTKFGAFVEVEKGVTGMVHISEVASTFVKEISDFITQGQEVKVKVMSIADDGKIAMSIKRAEAPAPARNNRNQQNNKSNNRPSSEPPQEFATYQEGSKSFEDMLSKFMQKSDEKISDLKKATDNRRGSYQKRR